MKILHINGTDEGGTYNLLFDIHKALIKKKIKTKIYLSSKKKKYKFFLSRKYLFLHSFLYN